MTLLGDVNLKNPLLENGAIPVTLRESFRLRWLTDVDWSKGNVPSEMEVFGTGADAVLRLAQKTSIDSDVPYTTPGNYTLSDVAKLEVDAGVLRHKSTVGSSQDWPFTTPANYTYNSSDIEVVGGKAKLVDKTPTDSQYFANYSSDSDANWGEGSLTATENGSPSVSGGYLDLTNATASSVSYQGATIAGGQTGCVRMIYQPNYSGSPASNLYLWRLKPNSGSGEIYCRHDNSGDIRVIIKDNAGVNTVSLLTGAGSFNPTANQDYEIEVNWDLTTGATRVFLDGSQLGSTDTNTGTLNSGTQEIYVGSYFPTSASGANSKMGGFIVYSTVQHSNNYTPAGLSGITSTKYTTTNPTIVPTSGFAFSSAVNSFTEISTKPGSDELRYHVSSDNGTTWKYWNGSAWAVTDDSYSQANDESVINTNIATLAASGTFLFRALLHSDDGATTPEIDDITVEESQAYSTDDNLYGDTKDASQISPASVIEWLTTTFTSTTPTNTEIRVLFSNNGRSSWLTWGGSAWVAPTSATTRTDATTLADAVTNFGSLPIGSGTLDVRAFMYTSSSAVRPSLANVNVTGNAGLYSSGVYYSSAFDSEDLDMEWNKVVYEVSTPSGTSAVIKVRAENQSSPFTELFGPPLNSGDDAGVVGRYVQFEVTLTGDGVSTSSLDMLSVDYESLARKIVAP